jgi:hypothetical protein
MIPAPIISPAMREYRRTCDILIFPSGAMQGLSGRARDVLVELFSEGPYRPVGPWLLEAIRRRGRMSAKMFDRCLAELREEGLLVGDQPPAALLAGWEDAWCDSFRRGEHSPGSEFEEMLTGGDGP